MRSGYFSLSFIENFLKVKCQSVTEDSSALDLPDIPNKYDPWERLISKVDLICISVSMHVSNRYIVLLRTFHE